MLYFQNNFVGPVIPIICFDNFFSTFFMQIVFEILLITVHVNYDLVY